jgi:hypothetical protein
MLNMPFTSLSLSVTTVKTTLVRHSKPVHHLFTGFIFDIFDQSFLYYQCLHAGDFHRVAAGLSENTSHMFFLRHQHAKTPFQRFARLQRINGSSSINFPRPGFDLIDH